MKLLAAALGSVVPLVAAAAAAGPRQLQAACAADQVADCNGACAEADWLGDGFCDDPSLNCAEYGFDGGDCAMGPEGEPAGGGGGAPSLAEVELMC
eukprot:COSAG04_NODE_9652_length_844_cov_1.018792_1_plen_95_part_10